MKIIDFVKNNKVPTIAVSVVLVAAVAVGVIFGVINHKDKVETKPFGDESSSDGSSSTISVPPIEGNSSVESTSSEESTSSASETIETSSTPSKAESVSSAQSSSKPTTTKPAPSQPSNTTSSAPVTSTPSNSGGGNSGSSTPSNGGTTSTPANSGGNTGTSTKWVCPDPSAHPQKSAAQCITQFDHSDFIAQHKAAEESKNNTTSRNPEDVGVKCWICGRPYGDGYNGTCLNYFCDGSYKCHHYDTGETCQIHHKG